MKYVGKLDRVLLIRIILPPFRQIQKRITELNQLKQQKRCLTKPADLPMVLGISCPISKGWRVKS
jgi:hypothetical protein